MPISLLMVVQGGAIGFRYSDIRDFSFRYSDIQYIFFRYSDIYILSDVRYFTTFIPIIRCFYFYFPKIRYLNQTSFEFRIIIRFNFHRALQEFLNGYPTSININTPQHVETTLPVWACPCLLVAMWCEGVFITYCCLVSCACFIGTCRHIHMIRGVV